jgi:hypothetical protein
VRTLSKRLPILSNPSAREETSRNLDISRYFSVALTCPPSVRFTQGREARTSNPKNDDSINSIKKIQTNFGFVQDLLY